jgi:hypothetical protein
MRSDLLAAIGQPYRRRRRRRMALAATGLVAAVGMTVTVVARGDDSVRVLAMSESEMTPTLRDAAAQCLTWSAEQGLQSRNDTPTPWSMTDLAVATERGDDSVVLFVTAERFVACDISTGWNGWGGIAHGTWASPTWMPGPVQKLGMSSTHIDGGQVLVTGRVSDRVHRLVLDHGDGHTSTARLGRGVFGLISEDNDVTDNAELISYDADGGEIGRQRLFGHLDHLEDQQCYVDPSGTIVLGEPGGVCLPAETWTR